MIDLIQRKFSRRTILTGIIFVLAITIGFSFSFNRDISSMEKDHLTEAQQKVISNPEGGYPKLNYSYNSEKEWLVLRTERPISILTGGLLIDNASYSPDFLLNTSSSEKRTNIWAQTSLLESLKFSEAPLTLGIKNFGYSGISDFPISTGEKLTIKKDFRDSDGDGTKGIENNETITVFTEQMDGSIEKFAYVSISNNTVRVYRLYSYSDNEWSDNEWKPCDLDREDLCETVQAYDFR